MNAIVKENPHLIDMFSELAVQMTMIKDIENDIIVYANDPCADGMGVPLDQIIGSHSSKFYSDYVAYNKDDWEIYNSGKARMGYLETFIDDSGTVNQLMTNKAPTQINGVPHVIIAAVNLTATIKKATASPDHGRAHRPEALAAVQEEHRKMAESLFA